MKIKKNKRMRKISPEVLYYAKIVKVYPGVALDILFYIHDPA